VSTEPPASPEASKESLVGTVEGRPAGPPAIGAHGLADSAQPAREGHRMSILRQLIEPVIARWLATGWQLTLSVGQPQGWTAWRVDTRRLKDLAARRGVDVGS